MMRTQRLGLLILLPALWFASAQTDPSLLSPDPLTPDQIAVYRAFLNDYHADKQQPLDLANVTDPFLADKSDFAGCLKGFPRISSLRLHPLTPSDVQDPKSPDPLIQLMKREDHQMADPETAIRSGQPVHDAVANGFLHGLLTVSEVIFDARHRHAAFSYSFRCGRLCGHGGILVYFRSGDRWMQAAQSCAPWIS